MRKETWSRQIKNYFKCAIAGILFLLTAALASGCGSRAVDDGEASGQKKVLSQAEIQELTDLLVVDATEDGWEEDEDDEDEERVPGIIEEDGDSNSHYTYIWGWKSDADWGEEDDDWDEDDDEDDMILAQCTDDGKILQTFSEEEIKLYSGKKDEATELVGVTDHEIICSADLYDKEDIWYRIPLSYENGSERVLFDKKEVIYRDKDEASLHDAVGKYLLCWGGGEPFILDREGWKKQEIPVDDKGCGYYGDVDSWIDPAGDLHIVLVTYRNNVPDVLYEYQTQTRQIQKITDEITSESRITSGDGKVFYTGLVNAQMHNDYNLYVYDMESGQTKVLASEVEIRDMLPGKPSDNADIIREVVYAQGMLYLEIRYADECYVLSCTPDQGELTFLEGMPGLVRHTEYPLSEPIEKGDDRYCNANDHNIFKYDEAEDGVVERTLEGAYVRTIRLSDFYEFLYANNRELIYQYTPDACKPSFFCSIPLTYMDGNDYPEVSRKTVITKCSDSKYESGVHRGCFCADERYLVYHTSVGRDFIVYDRKAEAFVDIANLPDKRDYSFSMNNIMTRRCGDYVCVDYSRDSSGKQEKADYGFFLYHFGDKKVTYIDSSPHAEELAVWSRDGKQIIYERFSSKSDDILEYAAYNIQSGDREVLFTETDLLSLLKKHETEYEKKDISGCVVDKMYLLSDKIYMVVGISLKDDFWQERVYSYDLAGGGLQYESQINAFVADGTDSVIGSYGMAEGKLFLEKHREKEDRSTIIKNSSKYYYYDLETGESDEIRKQDPECLYLSLID